MLLKCAKCKKDVALELSDCGPHIKASCAECGAYIKFISTRELQGEKAMSEFELFLKIEGSQYGDGVLLDKYGDRYSLVSARESKNGGTVWKQWAFPQTKDKKPMDKAVPMGVRLGNREQAIQILKQALAALSDRSGQLPHNDPVPRDDEPPF